MATGPQLAERDVVRFWLKVDASGPCWIWTASTTKARGGYGQFRTGGRTLRAHIVAYKLLVGPVPEGYVLDHLCRVPRCVNPDHLEVVTLAENTRRGMAPSAMAARTNRCVKGHPFTAETTIQRKNGKRECRTCENAAQRSRRSRKKVS